MPSKTQSYLYLWLFGRSSKYGKSKQGSFRDKIGKNFTHLFKYLRIYLIRKEVGPMKKEIKKETKEHPKEKKTEVKSEIKGSCGCGCLPPMKTK